MLPDCNVSYLLPGIQNQALKIFYSRLTEKKNECGDQPPVCTVVVRSSITTLHGAMVNAFDINWHAIHIHFYSDSLKTYTEYLFVNKENSIPQSLSDKLN